MKMLKQLLAKITHPKGTISLDGGPANNGTSNKNGDVIELDARKIIDHVESGDTIHMSSPSGSSGSVTLQGMTMKYVDTERAKELPAEIYQKIADVREGFGQVDEALQALWAKMSEDEREYISAAKHAVLSSIEELEKIADGDVAL